MCICMYVQTAARVFNAEAAAAEAVAEAEAAAGDWRAGDRLLPTRRAGTNKNTSRVAGAEWVRSRAACLYARMYVSMEWAGMEGRCQWRRRRQQRQQRQQRAGAGGGEWQGEERAMDEMTTTHARTHTHEHASMCFSTTGAQTRPAGGASAGFDDNDCGVGVVASRQPTHANTFPPTHSCRYSLQQQQRAPVPV